MRAATVTAAAALLLATPGRAAVSPTAAAPPPPPYYPTSCPADYPGQQETVLHWAHSLLNGTFQAGAGYANQVFLRDTATFIDIALDNVGEANATVRPLLLKLIAFQRLTGDIGCEGVGFSGPLSCMDKSTVEVDQETSYIIMIQKYVDKTNDIALLRLPVTSKADTTSRSVLERMERMLQYLMSTHVNASFPEQSGRLDPKYGLIWGATRADWGDIAPENGTHQQMNQLNHPAISLYDNAMLIIAMESFASLAALAGEAAIAVKWKAAASTQRSATIQHMWDRSRRKFRNHIYVGPIGGFQLSGSPFQGFDEEEIYYHGGTAVAIQAGLLNKTEIAYAHSRMLANVAAAGGKTTLGLALYPPYPRGSFSYGMDPYEYQNAGDWSWFGGRIVQALATNGFVKEARAALIPMVQRVCENKDFREWYGQSNNPSGSTRFHGSAGELARAIKLLRSLPQE